MSDTRHKDDCKMSFGRKDASCPRCQELMAGAEPRGPWGRNCNWNSDGTWNPKRSCYVEKAKSQLKYEQGGYAW